ncbi:hypothetical protein OS965_39655 [Streptomyces sp. H27-G5]|nr:hypothetical protein [Streptomyces sp. H27-G5]MCY0924159.1 hypothetical protein [Streptomyces sp. H27-G5]
MTRQLLARNARAADLQQRIDERPTCHGQITVALDFESALDSVAEFAML